MKSHLNAGTRREYPVGTLRSPKGHAHGERGDLAEDNPMAKPLRDYSPSNAFMKWMDKKENSNETILLIIIIMFVLGLIWGRVLL